MINVFLLQHMSWALGAPFLILTAHFPILLLKLGNNLCVNVIQLNTHPQLILPISSGDATLRQPSSTVAKDAPRLCIPSPIPAIPFHVTIHRLHP